MPDVETNALRRAKTLREEINTRTGVADTTVTEGVKRLLRSSGTEVAIQHEASMMLDIYPDPIIAREEFSRMMDYGDKISISEYDQIYYKKYEYFDVAGGFYGLTDLYPNDYDYVEAHLTFSAPLTPGSLYGDESARKCLILVETWNSTVSNQAYNSQWGMEMYGSNLQANVDYFIQSTLKNGLQRLVINNVQKGSYNKTGIPPNDKFTYILTYNLASNRQFHGRFKDITFYLNNTPIRNYIPGAKVISNGSGEYLFPGFYETINNTFLPNSGSSNPTNYGPEI